MRTGVATLDDARAIEAADPGGMLRLVASTGSQLGRGHALGTAIQGVPDADTDAVVVLGMGGSGIAGDVIRALYADVVAVPIVTSKGYAIPAFCGPRTLVLSASFSGETEETLAATRGAAALGCRVISLSAGGALAKLAAEEGRPHVAIPADAVVPRAALGYLVGACIGVLEAAGTIPAAGEEVAQAATFAAWFAAGLAPERPMEDNQAKTAASWIHGRTPVIWGSEGLAEAAALRWKAQLNENAKVPAFHATLSELDHNDVEGWSDGSGAGFVAIVLRHADEHPRIAARVGITRALVGAAGLEVNEVRASGASKLQRLLSLVLLGDFASVYLAILRGVDPTPVPVLSELKERLRT
ncbi:MAG: bifunctional phosphoglucose/phosphomannose isomerase [Actinobacteria bacterium]|nr:MAG: bifunctional phosphoglucose/phosphomannose isomerase [Actinomycetota bacterium]